MNPEPVKISALLRRHHVILKKKLGQNFLADPAVLEQIVDCAEIPGGGNVLEVGAGVGTLTRHLANRAGKVTAVELDQSLIPLLEEVLAGYTNVKIIHGDILQINPAEVMGQEDYLVVANIPYYITSALLRHLLETSHPPQRMVLTVQHEVAQRICEKAGALSLLALGVQVFGEPRIMMKISSGAFFPPPNVDSAVVRIDLYREACIPNSHLDLFFKLARAGFHQKRKKLRNSLAEGLHIPTQAVVEQLNKAGIDPDRRAQTVKIDEWHRLVEGWKE